MLGRFDIASNRRTNHHNSGTRSKYWFSWCFYQQLGSNMALRDGQLCSIIVSYDSVAKERHKKCPDAVVWERDKRSQCTSWERLHMLIGWCYRVWICFYFSLRDKGKSHQPFWRKWRWMNVEENRRSVWWAIKAWKGTWFMSFQRGLNGTANAGVLVYVKQICTL